MRQISQRELRNDNAQIIREVEHGETFVVTKHGVPVARLGPVATDAGLRLVKAARPGRSVTNLPRVALTRPSSEHLADQRGGR